MYTPTITFDLPLNDKRRISYLLALLRHGENVEIVQVRRGWTTSLRPCRKGEAMLTNSLKFQFRPPTIEELQRIVDEDQPLEQFDQDWFKSIEHIIVKFVTPFPSTVATVSFSAGLEVGMHIASHRWLACSQCNRDDKDCICGGIGTRDSEWAGLRECISFWQTQQRSAGSRALHSVCTSLQHYIDTGEWNGDSTVKQCVDSIELAAKVGEREIGGNEMLDWIRASLAEYPNTGGDTVVMGHVERIVNKFLKESCEANERKP